MYFLVSVIGVNYSWGFYQPLDINVFDFFSTPDFLLSAFQNIATLITGIFLTLVGIGIFVFLVYNSIRDSASDFSGEPRVRREAIILLSITLVSIFLVSIFSLFSLFSCWNWFVSPSNPISCWNWFVSPSNPTLYGVFFTILVLILAFLAFRSNKKLLSDPSSRGEQKDRVHRETIILVLVTLMYIGVSLFSWLCLPQVFPKALLYLISIGIFVALAFLAYRFINLASNPVRNADQVRRDERILVFIILIEATFIIPFLWGGVDSYAAREDVSRSVKVTLHKNAAQPETRLPIPNRTLLLGTTSSFHFFYECGEALIDENGAALKNKDGRPKKCENGRPFIIPTANIASLEFNPKKEKKDVPPHVGLPNIVAAIAAIKESSKKNTDKITAAINGLNIPGGQILCASSWEKVKTIGPFREGEHGQIEEGAKETAKGGLDQLVPLNQLVTKMNGHFTDQQTLQQLILIGRVDSVRLREEKRQFYGAQIELARARAEWVQKKLLKEFPTQIDPRRISLLSDNYREKNDNGHAPDRSVEVWACWTPKPTSPSADSPVRKGQTGD